MDTSDHGAQWRQRFFTSTRGRIVMLLRESARTVNELAERLELTDNAVRTHLASLERDGLIERAGQRRGGGKPSITYAITPDAEQLFPKAYSLVLTSLLATLDERLDDETRDALLAEAGRRLGPPTPVEGNLEERAAQAAEVLTGIGGLAAVERRDGRLFIQGRSCPLLDTAAQRPDICRLAAALVESLVGVPVTIRCAYGTRPRCCFELGSAA
ncbi:MAG TPA: ArsR family transcriptional regulator [Thermomicrobiales bacterium]|nr:ArsR family transcriptional regulator [Thermomicrobiales bacterium]